MAWGKGGTDSSGGASMTLSSVQASNFVQILQYQEDGGYSKWTFGVSSALTSGYNMRAGRMEEATISDLGSPDTGSSFYSNAQSSSSVPIFTVIQFANISGNKKTWRTINVYDEGNGSAPQMMHGGGSNDDTTGVWGKIVSTGNSSYDTTYSNLTALVDGFTPTSDVYPNLPTSTIYEETDTGKYKWWDGSTKWLKDGSEIGGVRGLFFGGYTSAQTNAIQYITIATKGNADTFGDMLVSKMARGGCADGTRGVMSGGESPKVTDMDYVTILTTGGATTFGDSTSARKGMMGYTSSETRGLFCGGEGDTQKIDYITIQTTGDATTFGTHAAATGTTTISDLTRALIHIAESTSDTYNEDIEYVTIDTEGNSTNFGDIIEGKSGTMAVSNLTRAVFAGGKYQSGSSSVRTTMDYVTIQIPTATASDFGDITYGRYMGGGASTTVRGCFGGGYYNDNNINVIDYITIDSTGNAEDFGDLSPATRGINGLSDII